MSRRVVEITDEWQLVSSKRALFEIIQEDQDVGNAILFNDVAAPLAAKRFKRGSKGQQILQSKDIKTYVKSEKVNLVTPYKITVDD